MLLRLRQMMRLYFAASRESARRGAFIRARGLWREYECANPRLMESYTVVDSNNAD